MDNSMKRIVAGLMLIAALLAGGASAAGAYPPGSPVLELSNRVVPPSTPFTATVTGCIIGETVVLSFIGNPSVTLICADGGDGTGVVTTVFISPPTGGTFEVTAVLGTTGVTLTDRVTVTVSTPATTTVTTTVTGATPTAGPGSLPRSGSGGIGTMSLMALGVVALGGSMAFVARTRRRDAAAAA